MTTPTIRLTRGVRVIDMSTGNAVAVDDTFQPPRVAVVAITSGTQRIKTEDDLLRDFRFIVNITGTSEADCLQRYSELDEFLQGAGDKSNPTWLEFKNNSDFPTEPRWGQLNGYRRYGVISGIVGVPSGFMEGETRATVLFRVDVDLELSPYALGLRQKLATATGAIITNELNGKPNGVTICEGANSDDNKFTNPVFGNDTFNANFTAGGSIDFSRETNPEFVRFGIVSYRAAAVAATNNTVTESINVGNTNTHVISCYVRLEDGTAPSSTHMQMFYDSAQATTFTADPERTGWYIAQASVTGLASDRNAGIVVKNGYNVFVDGFQLEERAYWTPLAYGDRLGHAWVTTAHASNTNRVEGSLSIPTSDALNIGEGTIIVAMKMRYAQNKGPFLAGGTRVFDTLNTTTFRLIWRLTGTHWRFSDGTNDIDGAADTWSKNDVLVFVITWSKANGLVLFKGDSSSLNTDTPHASGGTYTPAAFQTSLFIGSDSSPAKHHNSIYLAFDTFPREMTKAQVQNVYANMRPLLEDGQEVTAIPWLWTKDGDNIVDNDNTASADNFMVCGGIAGTAEAITEYQIQFTGTESNTSRGIFLTRYDVSPFNGFVEPNNEITTSASASTSVDTTEKDFDFEFTLTNDSRLIKGRGFYIIARISDAGSNLTAASAISYGGTGNQTTEFSDISAADGTFRAFKLPFSQSRDKDEVLYTSLEPDIVIHIIFKRTSGGSDTVTVNQVVLAATPALQIEFKNSGATTPVLYIIGRVVYLDDGTLSARDLVIDFPSVKGFPIHLVPKKLNIVLSVLGSHTRAHTEADTITYNNIIVTPRYTLL